MGLFSVDERSSPTAGTSRPRLERISGRRAFERLRLEGQRAQRGAVGINWVPGAGGPRVAYAVGRRVGSAVVRNRVRRRLRAVMGELAATLPAGDWLVSARPSAVDRTMPELRGDVVEAVAQLAPGPLHPAGRP